jgi:copper(I)-binding protein
LDLSSIAKKDNVVKTASRTIMVAALAIVFAIGVLHAQTSNSISIEKPFSRATPGGAQVGAGYMTITNKGAAADRLVAAASPAAGQVKIHEMSMDGGVMKMREVAGGLPIDAGKSVALAPGGYHLMLMGLKAPLKAGDKLPVTLTFEKAGNVEVTLDVQALGGQPSGGMSLPPSDGGHMHKM